MGQNEEYDRINSVGSKNSIIGKKTEIIDIISGDPKQAAKIRMETMYIPLIQEIFANQHYEEVWDEYGGGWREKAESYYKKIKEKDDTLLQFVQEDIDFHGIYFEEFGPKRPFTEESLDLLVKFHVFFGCLSFMHDRRIVRLSSPPKETYEYVPFNKVFKDNRVTNHAKMYED